LKRKATRQAIVVPVHAGETEHDGQLPLPWGPGEIEQGPVAVQSGLEQELDLARRDGEAGAGESLDVDQAQGILPEVVVGMDWRLPIQEPVPDGEMSAPPARATVRRHAARR
jgi:hypothetical protein